MTTIYLSLALLLSVAISLLGVIFHRHRAVLSLDFALVVLLFILSASGLLSTTIDLNGLLWWQHAGCQHYHLLENIEQLGGINGMIDKVEQKVQAHPNDAEGWFILGKLYLAKPNLTDALAAFQKAKTLAPGNHNIQQYIDFTIGKTKPT